MSKGYGSNKVSIDNQNERRDLDPAANPGFVGKYGQESHNDPMNVCNKPVDEVDHTTQGAPWNPDDRGEVKGQWDPLKVRDWDKDGK